MGEIQDYPQGTPVAGDLVPYVSDPAGTPALKLMDAPITPGGSDAADGSNTLEQVVTGTAETVVATVTKAAGSGALVIASISLSQNDPGENKDTTVRVRRTDATGAVLYSVSTGGSADSTAGLMFQYQASLYDDAPTGTWVLTVQATVGMPTIEIWVARRALAVI